MKQYFSLTLLSPDIDCALKPARVLDGSAMQTDDYSPQKRRWQSAPCACKLPDGRLLCTFSGDNFDAKRAYEQSKAFGEMADGEGPNNYHVILISSDDGLHWQPLTVVDHEDSVRTHEPLLWVDSHGTLYCFWSQSYRWWDDRSGVWMMKASIASDGGITWGSPLRLCDGVIAQPPTETKAGRILLPVSIWKKYKSGYHTAPEELSDPCVYELVGDDAVFLGRAHIEDTDFDENSLVEREDGSLLMIARCLKAVRGSISCDGGKTWSEPFKLMRHMSSRSFLSKFPSGNLLLVTNDHDAIRCNMTAFLSTDGGLTWPYRLLLDPRAEVSYPSGMVTPDGRCYVAYDHGRVTDKEILLASFTEEDIRRGTLGENSYIRLVCKAGE